MHGIRSWTVLTLPAAMFMLASVARAEPPAGGVEIWIRAFIPDPAHAGRAAEYVIPRPGNPAESIVRLLPTDRLPNRAAPPCFATDNRGFSSSEGTTARLETRFTIAPVQGGGARVTPSSGRTTASQTIEVNCSTGAQVATAPGKVDRDTLGRPAIADGTIQVIGQVTGKNELAARGLAPAIDYSFDVRWSPSSGRLIIAVSYGSFPSLEVYARTRESDWQPVLRHSPTGSPWSLAGDTLGINLERRQETLTLPIRR